VAQHKSGVLVDACMRCGGQFLDFGEAGHVVGERADPHKWAREAFARPPAPSWLHCPAGHGQMWSFVLAWEGQQVEIDGCGACNGIWLDRGEAEALNTITAAAAADKERPGSSKGTAGVVAMYILQLATMIPVEVYNPVKRRPWVVYSLIISLIVLFFVEMGLIAGVGKHVLDYVAVVPVKLEHGYVHTLITYQFLHGSIPHIAGNLYFLWIFGDNVEDRLGKPKFVLLYLVTGIVGGLAHWLGNLHGTQPMVGASGAIAGLMGAYVVLFPRVKVWVVLFFVQFKLRAIWYMAIWIGMQFLLMFDKSQEVAWLAHVGGFASGVALAFLLKPRAPAPPPQLQPQAR
jgi:membrane associated rhomboid family serine protease/Zn-finger nucleic acid-binding protein